MVGVKKDRCMPVGALLHAKELLGLPWVRGQGVSEQHHGVNEE